MNSILKKLSKSRVCMNIGTVIISMLMFALVLYYRNEGVINLQLIGALFLCFYSIIGITVLCCFIYEFIAKLLIIPENSILRCVVLNVAIIILAKIGCEYLDVANIQNLVYLIAPESLPLFVSIVLFPIIVMYWVDSIKKAYSNKSVIIGMGMIFFVSLVEIYLFHGSRVLVLEIIILLNTIVVYNAGKMVSGNKGKIQWIKAGVAGLFFSINNCFLINIKGKGIIEKSVNHFFDIQHWKLNDGVTNNDKLWDYHNVLRLVVYKGGNPLIGIYAILLVILLVLLIKMLCSKYEKAKRISYLTASSSVSYFVIKAIIYIMFACGMLNSQINIVFANIVDFVALGIILYSFYVIHKVEEDIKEIEEEKICYTKNIWESDGKLKVIEKNYIDNILLTVVVLNEADMQECNFMVMEEDFEYDENKYSALALTKDLNLFAILKNKEDEEYPYEIIDEKTQLEVFDEYQKQMREAYV